MAKNSELIRKHALANAFQHDGKASAGAVIGRVLAENHKLKDKIKDLQKEISDTVTEVNKLGKEEQEKELRKIYPEFFKEKKETKRELPELKNAKKGKVVTRLAPEPNGHLHIGHAIAFIFNQYYAEKYKGKLVLRFEDTNPENEKKEFYDSIQEDLKWLGINWDSMKNNSDDIEQFYMYAEDLIDSGHAYVCQCAVGEVRKMRGKGDPCGCRAQKPDKNLSLWKSMKKDMPEGSAILRFKGDMKANNTVMRDPTLFRIIESEHPIQEKKHRVWPLYDFANAIEDAICGVTHTIRSNEFQQRDELQNKIRDLLDLKNPEIISYSRIKVSGAPTSKREISALIDSGKIEGWDDPRLVTIKALKRRGILPETFKELALEVRMTSGSTTIDWKTIAGINRKLLDKQADRYYFVPDPVKLEVKDAPGKTAELKNHPDFPKKGTRKVKTSGVFYIPRDEKFKEGDVFRLKDLYNVKYISEGKAEFAGEKVTQDSKKVQWVTEDNVKLDVLIPEILDKEMETISGFAEKDVESLKEGDIVQFERFGFVRKDSAGFFILAHK